MNFERIFFYIMLFYKDCSQGLFLPFRLWNVLQGKWNE